MAKGSTKALGEEAASAGLKMTEKALISKKIEMK